MKILPAIAAIVLSAAAITPAAAVNTIHTTLDLTYPGVVAPGSGIASAPGSYTPIDPVTLGTNDTLDFTVDFGGHTLTMTSSFFLEALLYTPDYTSNVPFFDATLAFLNADGNVVASYSANNLFCCHWVGADQTISITHPFTFAGVRVTGLILGGSTATYTTPVFNIFAYSHPFAIGDVPEPASSTMMLAGFGLVGGALRSRRKAVVSFG